ncbi:MAG: hypothetical protein DRP87_09040 [Spirochaetes bacterium]|mgnify:CR=1 FL=1|nr:MAG: hypothetical protein DRP87_09040 [Spirochaetota bacterium]
MNHKEKMQRIGFIGLGLMGNPMALRLLEAGYPLRIWNRTRGKGRDLIERGAVWKETPKELAADSDVVITMVTDSEASEKVSCGEDGVLSGASSGLILIDMSSIEPAVSRSIAQRAEERGVTMLDAPVTGNPAVAAQGKLGIMVGGSKSAFKRCLAVFEKMGVKIVYAGESGSGTTLKLLNNLILGVVIMACGEAIVLASKSGIHPEKLIEITSVGGARTGAMETRGPRMIQRDFTPHFSTNNMYKDLTNVITLLPDVAIVDDVDHKLSP